MSPGIAVLGERLGWYGRRLRQMTPSEMGWRVRDRVRQETWTWRLAPRPLRPQPGSGVSATAAPGHSGRFPAHVRSDRRPPVLPRACDEGLATLPAAARRQVLATADDLLRGRGEVLGLQRDDLADPIWSLDPVSRRSYPTGRSAFRVDYRSPSDVRHVKQVWELSRHQHLTVLALAWRMTGDERYADMAARHLRSWWAHNPVVTGVNWASGIELGIRLISWTWTRRLLGTWQGAPGLFEDCGEARQQLYWHQRYLATFRSRGSSANNHVIAEAAGLLVASCAFPWFAESERWRRAATALLEAELARNTFPSGLDREQAFEYHGFVAELGLVAAAEAAACGHPLSSATLEVLRRMIDVTAAVLDRTGRPPRYGDGDDGRALLLAGPSADRWASLLSAGAACFGSLPWWPPTRADAAGVLLGGLLDGAGATPPPWGPRPQERPSDFPDAGLTILRSPPGADEELWCRCDGGPHGYLSIAAHAHADALSLELRHDGVEVLVDPGTYCYQGAPVWRQYFRSTVAHNTVELDRTNQSEPGGPFLWSRQAGTRVLEVAASTPVLQRWSAEHDGYLRLPVPARHRRRVELDLAGRSLTVLDELASTATHEVRLAFHLGPSVSVALHGHGARLRWRHPSGREVEAVMALPEQLAWTAHRGRGEPEPLGWYSPTFGRKVPTTTLLGTGPVASGVLRTELRLRGG